MRQKEAEAKAAKREDETDKEREDRRLQDAQAKASKRLSASVRQKGAEAKAAKQQSSSVRPRVLGEAKGS